jgi:DNA-binding transcriptional MerR regulator
MNSKMKFKIGEFSRLTGVTVKTLRYYEQIGLIEPDKIDEWTGYRYYSVVQMQTMSWIRSLKDIGFSLEEIRALHEDDTHKPSISQLEEKIRQCEHQLTRLQVRRTQLIQMADSQIKINKMENITIQSLPAIIVASHRRIISSYDDLGPLCVNIIGPEMHRLGCKCSQPGYCFAVEHREEYTPQNIDIEYCEQVEEMGHDSAIIKFKQLKEVPIAVCMKCYGPYDKLYSHYVYLFKYIEQQGYRPIDRHRTCYIDGSWNQEDPEKWLTVIQVPVAKV